MAFVGSLESVPYGRLAFVTICGPALLWCARDLRIPACRSVGGIFEPLVDLRAPAARSPFTLLRLRGACDDEGVRLLVLC